MLELLEQALATDRLTRLALEDTIFDRPRARIQKWAIDHDKGKLHYFTTCPFCFSIYAAALSFVMPRRVRQALAVADLVRIAYEVREHFA